MISMSRCNESVSLFACEVSESQNRTHSALDQISSFMVFDAVCCLFNEFEIGFDQKQWFCLHEPNYCLVSDLVFVSPHFVCN
jgi:hypothetical protein